MMKSSVESVKVEKQIKEYKEKNWLFILQLVIFILTVGSFVYTNLIVLKYQYISDFLIAVMLGIIAYNNAKIFKRKGFSIVYAICSLIFIVSGILGIING